MSPAAVVLVAALTVATIGVAVAAVILLRAHREFLLWEFRPARTDLQQWTVRTPGGTAYVTRIFDPDRGWTYRIESAFYGTETRIDYTAPYEGPARRRMSDLLDQAAATRDARKAKP